MRVVPLRLAIAAAGTGGHVMPGLAVAQALRTRGWSVAWLGTRTGMERGLVEGAGIGFDALDFASIRGKGSLVFGLGLIRLARATVAAVRLLRRLGPDAVLTTGGYIAVPVGLAAAVLRIPLVFLHADAAPQLSLRLLRPFVRLVLCGLDGGAARLAGARARLTGAPVRDAIAALPDPGQRLAGREGPLNLLVIGGSLGARVLNDTVPRALALIPEAARPQVVHQCGQGNEEATRAAYAAAGVVADVMPFIDDIAARYAAADLVLARAGAITVAELCAAGLGAVLVPLVVRTTSHQQGNAQHLAALGAAVHLRQADCTPEGLAGVLRGFTRVRLVEMARRARALGRPDATRAAVEAIAEVADRGPLFA